MQVSTASPPLWSPLVEGFKVVFHNTGQPHPKRNLMQDLLLAAMNEALLF